MKKIIIFFCVYCDIFAFDGYNFKELRDSDNFYKPTYPISKQQYEFKKHSNTTYNNTLTLDELNLLNKSLDYYYLYSLQIYNGRNRQKALQLQNTMKNLFDDKKYPIKIQYLQPNFIIILGEFFDYVQIVIFRHQIYPKLSNNIIRKFKIKVIM